jgi:hypothetical protein
MEFEMTAAVVVQIPVTTTVETSVRTAPAAAIPLILSGLLKAEDQSSAFCLSQ